MGWYGTWDIKYNGKDPELFQDLSKILIPNFQERFLVSNDGKSLDCQRDLSWYSADLDLKKITSYLHDGDSLEVEIDGETHPYDENDEELESELMTFRKENGKVIIEQDYVDEDRYHDNISQLKEIFDEYPDEYAEWVKQELMENGKIKPNIKAVYEAVVEEYAGANKERFLDIESEFTNEQNDFDNFLKSKIKQQALDNKIFEKPFIVRCDFAKEGMYLEQLINDEEPLVRVEVAKQGYGLEQLVNDKFAMVRIEVARQHYGLEQLISDEDPLVRCEVANQGYGLEKLTEDNISFVRKTAELKLQELSAERDEIEKDEIEEETDIDDFDDFLKEAHDQADKVNQQAQDKNISKDIDKDYER